MKNKGFIKITASLFVLVLLFSAYFVLKQINKEEMSEEESSSEEIYSVSSDEIEKITMLLDAKEVNFEKSDDEWENAAEPEFPVDQDKIDSILSSLESVLAERKMEGVEDLTEYGLDDPDQIIKIVTEDQTKTFEIGSYNDTAAGYYVTMDGNEEEVYIVGSDFVNTFGTTLYDYAKSDSFPVIAADEIDQIQVNKKEEPYTLKVSSDVSSGWMVESSESSEEADSTAVSAVTSSVNSLSYVDFVNYNCEDTSQYGLEDPQAEIVIQYHQTSEDEEGNETEEDKSITLKIGSKTEEDDNYYVTTDNKEIYTMTADSLENLIDQSVSDYWNLKVNYYAVTDIQTIYVVNNGETSTLRVETETNDDDEKEYTYYFNDEEADKNDFKNFFNSLVNISAKERLMENYQPEGEPEWIFTFTQSGQENTVSYYIYDENFYVAEKDDGISYLINKLDVTNLNSLLDTLKSE